MPQLELPLWPRGCLRRCLQDYICAVAHKLAAATVVDYQERADWLCRVLGNATPLAAVTFASLEHMVKEYGPRGRGLLMVTIRKRLRTLRAALTYAECHGLVEKVPRLPPQLYDDGRRGTDFYTTEQFARFSREVPAGPLTMFYGLGFWTGHHTWDVRIYERQWLDPDYPWLADDGRLLRRGRYWRLNHKNPRRPEGTWLVMEPELRELAVAWIGANPHWKDDSKVVGRVWPRSSAARAAAAAGLHAVTPNRGMRRSFATMLASRGYPNEYIRHALGHEGEAWIERQHGASPRVRTTRPTTATAHYLCLSPELIRRVIDR